MSGREGFSLIEVVVAMVILAFGLLAMAATTGSILTRTRIAARRTERDAAVQYAIEELRGGGYATIGARCGAFDRQIGGYVVTCDFTPLSGTLARLRFVSSGPGYTGGSWSTDATDTLSVDVAR